MALINLLVILLIVGVTLQSVNLLLPMRPGLKRALNGIVAAAVILWLLQILGLVSTWSALPIGA